MVYIFLISNDLLVTRITVCYTQLRAERSAAIIEPIFFARYSVHLLGEVGDRIAGAFVTRGGLALVSHSPVFFCYLGPAPRARLFVIRGQDQILQLPNFRAGGGVIKAGGATQEAGRQKNCEYHRSHLHVVLFLSLNQ